MKSLCKKSFVFTLAAAAFLFGMATPGIAFGQKQESRSTPRKERVVFSKPRKTILTDKVAPNVIVVKFHEGTHIRVRSGQWIADLGHLAPAEERLLRRNNLDRFKVVQELGLVNNLFQRNSNLRFERSFTRPESELDLEKQQGELNTNEELADLNLYYHILIDNDQPEETQQLIDRLNAMDIVEIAYPRPIYESAQACTDIPPATPNFTNQQGYLNAAHTTDPNSNGIDARYAWNFPGGKGAGVRMIDVESGWNAHEDLPDLFFTRGISDPFDTNQDRQHGTAVLGVVAGCENNYGITGIAPRTAMGTSSIIAPTFGQYLADAINAAAANLGAGDILLIEQHAHGPSSGQVCPCNCEQFEFVAADYWQDNFDAVRNATARGIIVVEAAGNGSMNLDSPIYQGRFDRALRDSGAILVGAGGSVNRAPPCWTNSGSRIDVQGWGDSVVTLGYGNLAMVNGPDQRQWYTNSFSGTSSASPIVVGAAADIQGFRLARGLPVLTSVQMRDLLRRTGTAQAADPRQIGPLPDLRTALDSHGTFCSGIIPNSGFQFGPGFVAPSGYRDYCFTASQGQTFEFTTCAPGSADFDTIIDVRDATGTTILASNDDSCGVQSRLIWQAPGNGVYLARMRGFGSNTGSFSLAYRTVPAACTAVITPAANFQFANGAIAPGQMRDYCFSATAGQRLDFQTCAPGSANFDTIIDVLSADGTEVYVSNDDACGLQSQISTWLVPANASYRVRVRGYQTASGNFSLAYRLSPVTCTAAITPEPTFRFVAGTVATGTSRDYCFNASAGQRFDFQTCPPGGAGMPTVLDVRDSTGTSILATNQGSCGQQSQISAWQAPNNGQYRVTVRVPSTIAASGTFSMAYRLTPGTIAGTVRRASDNTPIGGATIQALQSSMPRGSATADASGNYTINDLTPGTYDVAGSAAGFIPQTRGGVVITAGTTTSANFAMVITPGAIAGQVTRIFDGTPVGNATIQVAGPQTGSAMTDAAGNFVMADLTPGIYTANASAVGYTSQTIGAIAVNPGTTTPVNFALVALPGGIGGQVTKASDGTPLGGATVRVFPGGRSDTTNVNGNYLIDTVTPGTYNVACSAPGFMSVIALVVVNPGSTATANFALEQLPVSFVPTANLATGVTPYSVISRDLNGDGWADLVVANSGSNNVSVLLATGGGAFAQAATYGAGMSPTSVTADDVNGDGKWDLIVANRDSNNVSVLLGNGDGTFQMAVNYPVGGQPAFVATADLNNDSHPDIVAVNKDANSVSRLLNNGDGTFGAALDFATGAAPTSVAIRDFNSDGNDDLAVVNQDEGTVAILLGDGTGSFAPGAVLMTANAPVYIIVGDFNGDSKLDLATADSGSNGVSVFLGNGNGTFAAARSFATGTRPLSLTGGDFNADGKEDLAIVNFGSNNLSILLGDGAGNFTLGASFPVGDQPRSVVSADFDGNGKPDLAVTNSGSNNVSILLNNTLP